MALTRPDWAVQTAFNADPNDSTQLPIWSDLTAVVLSASSIGRGRQYELDQVRATDPGVSLLDPNEYLNPGNPSSPYSPNVVPYRQLLWQGMYPNGGTGNLLNANTQGQAYDCSFESYNTGSQPPWITAVGGTTPAITITTPRTGTKSLTWATLATTTVQGVSWQVPCIPGRQYTSSAYVRQTAASTQSLRVTDQNTVVDAFNRTVSNGWGTADLGGAWTVNGGSASDYSVAAGLATHSLATIGTSRKTTAGSLQDADVRVVATTPVKALGDTIELQALLRFVDASNYYYAGARLYTDGSVTAVIGKVVAGANTTLVEVAVPIVYGAGSSFAMRATVAGPALQCKVWPVAQGEPAAWSATTADTALTAAGGVGCRSILNSSSTNTTPVTVTFDQFAAAGSVVGTSTSTTGAYVRLTVTWTATQPSHTVQLATLGTGVAGNAQVDDVQHEPGGSASTAVTTGPLIFGVVRPYVERWPSAWEDDSNGFLGRCDAEAVDAFAVLAQAPVFTEYVNSVLAKDPLYYWTLGEAQGATNFAERSGNGGPPLSLLPSPYGGPGTPPVVGTNPSTSIAGDAGGTSVKFTADLTNLPEQGTAIACGLFGLPALPLGLPATPSTAWKGTATVWLNTTQTAYQAGDVPNVFQLKNVRNTGGLQARPFWLDVVPSGGNTGKLGFGLTGDVSTPSIVSTARVDDGVWHHIVATASQDATNTTLTLFIDGTQVATTTVATSTVGLLADTANCVEIGGGWDNSYTGGTLTGYVAHAAIWNRILSSAEITDLWSAGKGYIGENSGARTARYLSYGWLGQTAIDTGQSTMGVSPLTGGNVLDAVQATTTTENGNFWIDARGRAVSTSRTRRYLTTTAAYVFGENTAGGEIPYEGDFAFDFDPTQVNNDVNITNQPGGFTARAVDAASQKRYFPRQFTRDITAATDLEAVDAANYILATRKAALQRVNTLTLNLGANPALWLVVASLEPGVRVTVKRRSKAANNGAGLTQSADFFVEQISHDGIDLEEGTWLARLQLSPVARFQVGILDDATFGLLDTTLILAY